MLRESVVATRATAPYLAERRRARGAAAEEEEGEVLENELIVTVPADLTATELHAHIKRQTGIKALEARCDVFAGVDSLATPCNPDPNPKPNPNPIPNPNPKSNPYLGMTMISEGVAAGHMKHVTKEVKGDVGRCTEMYGDIRRYTEIPAT